MKFNVLKENILKALMVTARNLPSRPQLPILSNILIKTDKNILKLSSTDLEIGITYEIPAKIENEGEVALPGKLLLDFVNTLSAEKIDFELNEKNMVVKTPHTQSTFAVSSVSDFPPFPTLSDSKKSLPLDKLKTSIERVIFAASNDETRPVLTGVKTTVSKGKIHLTATDGYRMSLDTVEITKKDDEFNVILPAQTLDEVVRISSELNVKEIDFYMIENKNQIVFSLPGVSVFTRLIDGEYPNVEKIIPSDFKTKVTVDREHFLSGVKTSSLFARGAANIVKIKIGKDGLKLSANTPQVGENEEFIEAKVEGEETEIAFNYRFLLDILSKLQNEEVVFETSGSLSPGVFKDAKLPSYLHIIMPVRVQT